MFWIVVALCSVAITYYWSVGAVLMKEAWNDSSGVSSSNAAMHFLYGLMLFVVLLVVLVQEI